MKFLYEYTWKDMIYFPIISICFTIIAIISLQVGRTPTTKLQDTTVTLESWKWDGTPRHRSLIITDVDNGEYYVDGIFLANGAFNIHDWNSFDLKEGSILNVTFLQKENGTRSVFALSSNYYTFMTVDAAMIVEEENNTWARNVAITSTILALLFFFPILAKGIISFKASKSDVNIYNQTEKGILDNYLKGINVYSPFICTVFRLHVSIGQVIKSGDVLLTVVALGMQMPIVAESDGIVREIYVNQGSVVEKDAILMYIDNIVYN